MSAVPAISFEDDWDDGRVTNDDMSQDGVYEQPVRPRFPVQCQEPNRNATPRHQLTRYVPVALLGMVLASYAFYFVACSVLTMWGRSQENELEKALREAEAERQELIARVERNQAPGPILFRAGSELGMKPAVDRRFVELPNQRGGTPP